MSLFANLTTGSTLLTPNRRLAASLLKLHHQEQKDLNKECWTSFDILPYVSWLERLWLHYTAKTIADNPLVLANHQEQVIWENILYDSPASDYLLQISGTAELAKSAWSILKQWRVDINNSSLKTTEDALTFQKWAVNFQNLCQKNHWVDSNSLAELIIKKIVDADIQLPEKIILAGFTELTPLEEVLFKACEAMDCPVTHLELPHTTNQLQRISLQDKETEILTMARWAKSILEKNPTTSIGCTVPDLEKSRNTVIRIFSEVFASENKYILDYTTLPINISAGRNLSHYPIIHTALQLLRLKSENIPIDIFSNLLRSPFLGEAETEMLKRTQLESRLRNANSSIVSLTKLLKKSFLVECPALAKRLQDYLELHKLSKNIRTASVWTTFFMEELTMLGWPGERSLNSHEYQVVESWLELLTDYASFEHILGPTSHQRALDYLTQMTNSKIFQPKSPDAPIQILGMLEATEIPFDYLWVMGLDDTSWPPTPKPNPFIPIRLQKNLKMPHATAEKELSYCLQLTEQLKHTAYEVIFSSAQQDQDTELRPSPLIADITEIPLTSLSLPEFIAPARRVFATKACELIQDDIASTLTREEKFLGGASIFKLQAACPFKAFAELRLAAKITEAPTLGLKPQERGNIIHKILEIIWLELKDQSALFLQNDKNLQTLIKNAIEKAFSTLDNEAINNVRYRELETNRLEKIILEWLELEKKRPPFTVIALEQERAINISQMEIKLRIDRVDEIDQGKIIIDYKTGAKQEIKAWFGTRPDEPQLPLYAISEPLETVALAFAEINPTTMKWNGVSAFDLTIDNVKTLDKVKYPHALNWQAQLYEWQQTLEKLGNDFAEGRAEVDPKNPMKTCLHCDLQTFCRIYESIE